jgi:hypothetical protein
MHSTDIQYFTRPKGDHLDQVHSDQMVLKTIRLGEAGPFYQRPRVSKITRRRLSGLSPLSQIVLVTVRW